MMTMIDILAPQRIRVHRDTTVSNERLNEERAEHASTVKERDTVGPRRTITITEPDGTSKTFRTGDKIWRGPGCIQSGADWEALKQNKDIVCQTDSQYAVANDLPSARHIIGEQAIVTRRGIKGPKEIVCALDFATAPYPESRMFSQGRWLEAGELHPGSDGSEVLEQCLADGRIIDRKFSDKVKTAAKRVLSKGTGKASK